MSTLEQVGRGSRIAERPVVERDDQVLVAAVREGDDRAFEELYERYHGRIWGFVASMVKDHQRSEDVTQEVFLSALRRLRQTRAPIAFKPWLYEIARNACIDQHRRMRRSREVPMGEELSEPVRQASTSPSPHAALNAKEQIENLCDAFSGLTDTQHEMLVMREFEGRSYHDIGERLDLTKSAVESALFRARRRLMQEYQELISGGRCARVQRAIHSTPSASEPVRDWRIALHLSRCPSCRASARVRGLRFVGAPPRRIAALLPLPAVLPRAAGGWRARLTGSWSGRSELFSRGPLAVGGDSTLPGLITAGAAAATVALALGSTSVLGAHAGHGAAPAAHRAVVSPSPAGHAWSTLPQAAVSSAARGTPGAPGLRGRAHSLGGASHPRNSFPAMAAAAQSAQGTFSSGSAGGSRRRAGGRLSVGGSAPSLTGTLGLPAVTPSVPLPVAVPGVNRAPGRRVPSGGAPSGSGAPGLLPSVGSLPAAGAATSSAAGGVGSGVSRLSRQSG